MYRLLSPFHLFAPAAAALGIQYVGGVVGGQSNSISTFDVSLDGTLTGGLADTPSEGDQVIVVIGAVCGNDTIAVSCVADGTGASYTAVRSAAYVNGNPDTRFAVYRREQSATVDSFIRIGAGTNLSSGGGAALVMVFRPVDATTPLDLAIATAQSVGAGNDINPPSITPVTDRALIIACGAHGCLAASTTEPTRNGWSPSLYRLQTGTTYGVKVAAECLVWRTGDGAIDPAAWADPDTGEVNPTWAAATIALRPAA